jgi:XRE family transcriptional regulator, thiamine biosynthesis regulator
MVDYFLPNIRGAVAHELAERGHSQRKIALELGITQARVSHYLSSKKNSYYTNLTKNFGTRQSELEGFARILSDDMVRSQVEGIFTLYSIWKNMLFNGDVCAIHQKRYSISKECSVCMDLQKPQHEPSEALSSKDENYVILRNLSEAVKLIESSPSFPLIMPEVSVNIAMCKSNPKSKRDVAAIPGRISKIHGRAKAFVLPEFGSSNHMSNVLLLFNARASYLRAVINLRYDEFVDQILSAMKLPKIVAKEKTKSQRKYLTSSDNLLSPDDVVLQRLSGISLPEKLVEDNLCFAIVDCGSAGVEPITYLFGPKATEISQLAIKIGNSYSNIVQSMGPVAMDIHDKLDMQDRSLV